MPIKLPAKVKISPKAMSTLWWISAIGGQRKPVPKRRQPKPHRTTDKISWSFFIIVEFFLPTGIPTRFVISGGRAEALSALTTAVGQCTKLPNARTKMHNATDSMSWMFFFIVFLFLFPRISRIFTDFISTFISDGLCRSRECFRYLIPPVGSRYILLQLAVSPFIRFANFVTVCDTEWLRSYHGKFAHTL